MDQGRLLLEAQNLDVRRARLEKTLSEMPEKRAILEVRKRISDIESLMERTESFIREIEKVVARDEDAVSAISAKMESEQAKLLSGKITNPKEVQHISNELDMLRRQKESLENEILAQMEKREKAMGQRAKVEAALDEARTKEAALVEGFKGKGGALQQEIEEVKASFERVMGQLSEEPRARYEHAREGRGGVVVGILEGTSCGACRMELPAETVRDLRAGPPIAECPLCRRILVVGVPEDATDE